jgi:hypothetical protein
MNSQILYLEPFGVVHNQGNLTGEYNTKIQKSVKTYFYNAYIELNKKPILEDEFSEWKKVMSDSLEEHKEAWNKLSNL